MKRRFGRLRSQDSPFFPLSPPEASAEIVAPPDFVGIGAQRAGSSWWFDLVTSHPQVHHPSPLVVHKERHFFSHLAFEEVSNEDLAQRYAQWFPRPQGTLTGEWTPDYMHYSWVAPMLAVAAPRSRLIAILRDPIERFLSGAAHSLAINRGALPPGDVIQDAVDRGRYGQQLKLWFELFPPEQILVLQYESCVKDPAFELDRTFRFLGLSSAAAPDIPQAIVNPSRAEKARLPARTRRTLASTYEDDIHTLVALAPDLDLGLWSTFSGSL